MNRILFNDTNQQHMDFRQYHCCCSFGAFSNFEILPIKNSCRAPKKDLGFLQEEKDKSQAVSNGEVDLTLHFFVFWFGVLQPVIPNRLYSRSLEGLSHRDFTPTN